MFDKIKGIMQMRSEAKRTQAALEKLVCDYENGGIRISMRGDFMVNSVTISQEVLEEAAKGKPERFQTMLANVINGAIKNAKKASQEQMMKMLEESGGLQGLFGK